MVRRYSPPTSKSARVICPRDAARTARISPAKTLTPKSATCRSQRVGGADHQHAAGARGATGFSRRCSPISGLRGLGVDRAAADRAVGPVEGAGVLESLDVGPGAARSSAAASPTPRAYAKLQLKEPK